MRRIELLKEKLYEIESDGDYEFSKANTIFEVLDVEKKYLNRVNHACTLCVAKSNKEEANELWEEATAYIENARYFRIEELENN